MKFTDDPRLTAYALGELEGTDRVEVETLLESEPAARAFVDDVRRTAAELEAGLKGELTKAGDARLLPAQRSAVERAAAAGPAKKLPRKRSVGAREWLGIAFAATLLGVVGTAYFGRQRYASPDESTSILANRDSAPARGPAGSLQGMGYASTVLPTATALPKSKSVVGNAPTLGRTTSRYHPPVDSIPALGYGTKVDEFFGDSENEQELSREAYERIYENPFFLAAVEQLSTFSIDVDTASYTNVRRMLVGGSMPPPDAVRVEEFVNYFQYGYEPPEGKVPFSVSVEVGAAPWNPEHRLVRVGLKGRPVDASERKPANLVFLLDVSGSMDNPNKLPLLKRSMQMLVQHLGAGDRVAIAVYAGASGLVLPSTSCEYPLEILQSLEDLRAGGSTNGGAGIELAYKVAQENFIEGGINRVILATDGDFNVGTTSDADLERLIEQKAKTGVFLSVLGFGMGNYQDAKLEKLSGRGNGHFAYIDSLLEAKKVLVEELGATLETIAKDVKIQVDFNPVEVKGYRLIGYENRVLEHQDFLDDTKDAGEIGAGHTVTALYEVVPAGGNLDVPGIEPSKYVQPAEVSSEALEGELLTVRLRYKLPQADTSEPLEVSVVDGGANFFELGEDTRFAASVAAFGMILRSSKNVGEATLEDVRRWAVESLGEDEGGYREQFLKLVDRAIEKR
ncbi:MAG: DUF3520 domain-containing protein [bacterium]|nr:DUF3520 domain-containing protein [bacterium]